MLVESFLLSLVGASAGLLLAWHPGRDRVAWPAAAASATPSRPIASSCARALSRRADNAPVRRRRRRCGRAGRTSRPGSERRDRARPAAVQRAKRVHRRAGRGVVDAARRVVAVPPQPDADPARRSRLRFRSRCRDAHSTSRRYAAGWQHGARLRIAWSNGSRDSGVRSAAVTALVPLGGDALVASFHPAGRSDIPGTRPSTLSVGPRYFETLAIPACPGREFDAAGS